MQSQGDAMLTMKKLSEDDTSAKLITPALHQAGWAESAIRRQVAFTAGRIIAKVDELMALCDQLETQLTTTQTDSGRFVEAVLEAALTPACGLGD